MALNIAEMINAVHGVHCHQCYDLSISYHQCHKVTKSLNRYPCICLYHCVCACFCLLSSPLINCWKKSQLCGIPLKCFHGSDYSWTSWSTVNVTNRIVLVSYKTPFWHLSHQAPQCGGRSCHGFARSRTFCTSSAWSEKNWIGHC